MRKKELVEFRKHKRFYYEKGGPFAVTGPDSLHLGQIVNISLGGFAFRYIANGKKWLNDLVDFKVFFGEDVFPLHDMQIETIFDTNKNCPSTFISKNLRHRGVRFVNLTPEQEDLLQTYIDTHICGRCMNFEQEAPSEIECKSACIYDPSFIKAERKNMSDTSQAL